ncbi:MAG: spore coat associated protein CotJA [Lachnospiraceae bacterium]|nr:spore coat associated protein CotJA [Lachnospiraceae bacterium]
MPIAMAYVPWQHFHTTYEVDKALAYGTIFPELNKPFYGRRGVNR